jgi:3-oxosteroid 1-dehydrogenase
MATQNEAPIVETVDCDVAVFGSGAAGMTAALVAACEGQRVVLFEKAEQLGGTTATSGGAIWIPGNSQAARAGVRDTLEAGRRLIAHEAGAAFRADLADAYLSSGAEAVDYLAQHTELRFDYMPAPDYQTNSPGAADTGRCLGPPAFDGERLREHFKRVLPPRPAFTVLGGLMVGRREIPMLLRPWASWTALRHVVGLLGRHARDRLRHARGTRLLMGNALIARALYSGLERGVVYRTGAAMESLDSEGGRVVGARVRTAAGLAQVRARRAVVLATGGFAHDAALRQAHAPAHPHVHSLASPGNVGDGLRAARAIGGDVDDAVASPGFWTPASVARDAAGRETVFPYGHMDRGKPGAIIVGNDGRRFVNEADSYHEVVVAMYKAGAVAPHGRAFLVCDHAFIRRYGLGLVRPTPFPLRPYLKSGYLHRAATPALLARQLGIDPAGLEEEVRRHKRYAEQGVDPDFGKGGSVFNRYNGEDRGQPNACLLPLEQAPYYAIELFPCTLGTAAGVRTNADAQVLRVDGTPIAGLYACGNEMGSVVRGAYPGPGITIGPAVVFGYRAMRHAVGKAPASSVAAEAAPRPQAEVCL